MLQLPNQLQNIKKPMKYRLSPFSPLTRKQIQSSSTPTKDADSLPSLTSKTKMKTESSQHREYSHLQIRTEPSVEPKEEYSPSYRLLSRFIYNHLQKKIQFQEQAYQDIKENQIGRRQYGYINEQSEPKSDHHTGEMITRHQPHVYAYERQTLNNPNATNFTHNIRTKNRMHPRHNKLLMRSQVSKQDRAHSHKGTNRRTNIDAYFDLSCLRTENKNKSFIPNF